MKIENEFVVAASLSDTWRAFMDIQRVASCLPGATVEPTAEHGVFSGHMRVKLGAVTSEYRGLARIRETDEDAYVAVFDVDGKEARGQGTASASITTRLTPDSNGTKVTVETDLKISGRQRQFGRGLMTDVAGAILTEFAKRLEQEILTGQSSGSAAPAESGPIAGRPSAVSEQRPPAAAPATREDDVMDLAGAVWLPVAKRALPAVGAMVALGLLGTVLARRQRGRPRISLKLELGR